MNTQYELFVEKFKPKKTTDDCYTPQNLYDAICQYVVNKFNLQGRTIVRPFYPGGDFESYEYPDDCVVIDNPPFSIFTHICRYYDKKGIKFFLFAPDLTMSSAYPFATLATISETITYENGAKVQTSFVSNLYDKAIGITTDPNLKHIIKQENNKNNASKIKKLTKRKHPDNITSTALLNKFSNHDFYITRDNLILQTHPDNCKEFFSNSFLISNKVKKMIKELERKEPERKEPESVKTYELSEREKKLIENMPQQ